MSREVGSLVITGAACAVLVWIIVEDLRCYRIRNSAVLMLAACFVIDCVVAGRASLIAPHALLAGGVFALAAAGFALRLMGGGDAKLLTAALLWVGPEGSAVFACLLFVMTLTYTVVALCGIAPARRVGGRLAIPFGPSIGLAWLGFIGFVLWR